MVSIMDRPGFRARTDNIVLVEPGVRRLLWVPRDLWCDCLGTRIASAFAMGGHLALREALAEHGLHADHGISLARPFVERLLRRVHVTVPVEESLVLRYPMNPSERIEDGSKIVTFEPPAERLTGERIHQWIGARMAVRGQRGDLGRIRRQQAFVRCVLEQPIPWPAGRPGRDFRRTGRRAVEELRQVRSDWSMETFDEVDLCETHGMSVLRSRRPPLGPGCLSAKATLAVAARRVLHRVLGIWPREGRLRLRRLFSQLPR